MNVSPLGVVAHILVIIGGINWGLIGFFNFNLVDAIFGDDSALSRVIYALVGLAALYVLYELLTSRQKAAHRTAVQPGN